MLTRRAALQSLAAAFSQRSQGPRKPNFVILLADDLGYGDIACFGSPVPTPHIDSLAAAGVRFTDGYVTNAVCSPSRAGMLTGRYQQRFGHEFNPESPERDIRDHLGLPLSETILPKMLKKAGYSTGAVGKWHLGGNPEFHPLERGFDEFFGFMHGDNTYLIGESSDGDSEPLAGGSGGKIPAVRTEPIFRGRTPVTEKQYLTEAFAREAVAFIDRHKQEPFFLYLAFNAVHSPLQATSKYVDRFANIPDRKHRMLAAMTSALDDAVGRVLAKLKESGLEKDTLVVFLSDNGSPIFIGAGSNGPLSGSKRTLFEGGIRVPFAMRWPSRLRPGQVYKKPVSSLDFVPTFLAAAGAAKTTQLDGVDLMPYLEGGNQGEPNPRLFWRMGRNSAMRAGNWKLIRFGDKPRLYDLSADIGERHDLAGSKPEVVREMIGALNQWNSQLIAPKWPPRLSPVVPVNGENFVWDV